MKDIAITSWFVAELKFEGVTHFTLGTSPALVTMNYLGQPIDSLLASSPKTMFRKEASWMEIINTCYTMYLYGA